MSSPLLKPYSMDLDVAITDDELKYSTIDTGVRLPVILWAMAFVIEEYSDAPSFSYSIQPL